MSAFNTAQQIAVQYQSSSDQIDTSEVYMAMVWQQKKLGAAYYDADSAFLYVMNDCSESLDFDNSKMLLQQISPTILVSMVKTDARFTTFLRGLSDEALADDESSGGQVESVIGNNSVSIPVAQNDGSSSSTNRFYKLDLIPNQDFGLTAAKQRIMLLNIPHMPNNMTESEKHVYFSSIFPVESINSYRATGALLKYLNQKRIGVELEGDGVQTPILTVKQFVIDKVMLLNRDAFYGLQIFSPRSHPSVYKVAFKNSGKEGLSLRSVLQSYCVSAVGRKCMSLWLLRPLQDLQRINDRLVAISYFTNPKRAYLVNELQSCIKNIRDISRFLFRMENAPISVTEWRSFRENLRACCELSEICRRHNSQIRFLDDVLSFPQSGESNSASKMAQLTEAMDLINRVVDFEQSSIERRCVVKPNVDNELDEKKRTYCSLPALMDAIAKEESTDLMPYVSSQITLVYEPQFGFFVSVPETEEMRLSGCHDIPTLEYRFTNNGISHYKSQKTLDLDERMGDVFSDLRDREIEILMRLQKAVIHVSEPLIHVIECASTLDCLLAFSVCAIQNNYTRPIVTEEIGVDIINGRHPLQEKTCSQFIPNNAKIDDEGKVLIVTGTNASGKSVYLKQIAVIVYMAHLGSFVPAEGATVGIVDRIYTRIKAFDSVSSGLSAFVLDLNQVIPATLYATKRSLVVLDEFGRGTDAVDGAAVLASTINSWVRRPECCPMVVVCTHMHDIVNLNIISNSKLVKYLTTEIARLPNGRIVFLYKVVPGRADGSHAASVCVLGGLPETTAARAKEVTECYVSLKPIPNRPINEELLQGVDEIVKTFAGLNVDSREDVFHFLKDIQQLTLNS